VKTLCALIGAFFLVAGLVVLIAGPPNAGPRSVRTAAARPASADGHRQLLWEAEAGRSRAEAPATEAVSRNP
jgi:hypothetical protein